MEIAIALLAGAALGLLLSEARIPRVKTAPLAGVAVLGVLAVVLIITRAGNPTAVAFTFLIATIVSFALYAGVLWQREQLDPTVNYWGWVRRELTHPRYGRELSEDARNRAAECLSSVEPN
jgi:hypothetical protein